MKGITGMFHRIGDAEAVSLDQGSVISRMSFNEEDQQITLTLREGSSTTVKAHHDDYDAYVRFIQSCPLLVSELQAQKLRKIRSDNADPELDEMPRTLFTVFQTLPGSEGLELRLNETGAGSLWTKEPETRRVLEWTDFNEGLSMLLRIRKGA
jgi:hypothetical protein